MAENDSNMIDLVLTHLTHPWGPPWTLATLGDPWRPLATLGDMPENGHFWGKCPFSGAQKWDFECPNPKSETTFSRQHPPKMVIFKHVAKGRQGSPRAAKGFQGPRGTPGMGEMSFNQIDHI